MHSTIERLITKYFDFDWNWSEVSENPGVSWQFILDNLHNYFWDFKYISANRNVTWDIVQSHPEFDWCYENLSRNQNITPKIVKENPDVGWDDLLLLTNPNFDYENTNVYKIESEQIEYFSMNKNCTIDILEKNNIKPNYNTFSRNVNLTIDYIKDNSFESWDWYYLPAHRNITLKMITENNLPWKFDWLGSNKNITIDMFDSKPEFKYNVDIEYIYNWSAISRNPNITYDFVVENISDIEFSELSYNLFEYDDNKYKN